MNRTNLTNPVLAVILAVLCAWLLLFAFKGSAAVPGSTPAEAQANEFAAIQSAARAEALAFLEIDHTRMDELTDRVLAGATGDFKEQYESSLDALKKSASDQKSFSEGRVDKVGLSEVDQDSATAFVAAGSEVKNEGTKGEVEDRFWRMRLSMVKEQGQWLVSQLEFVS